VIRAGLADVGTDPSYSGGMRHGKPLSLPLIVPLPGLGGAVTAAVVIILIALN